MSLTTKNVRVNGYPPLDVVLAHFDAMPVLIGIVNQFAPSELSKWDRARNMPRSSLPLQPLNRVAEGIIEGSDERSTSAFNALIEAGV